MKVIIMKSAKKDMKKLASEIRKKVDKEIRLLRYGKIPIITLVGHSDIGKLKIDNYRVLYYIDKKNKEIHITDVSLRKDAYKSL